MRMGMIGLGRMGGNMVRRLLGGGHQIAVFDGDPDKVSRTAGEGAEAAYSLDELVRKLAPPRAIWLMVPAAVVDSVLADLAPRLASGDTVIDGGNSHYVDDIRRAGELAARGIHYLDAGVSGGVWGLERGYCLMIGGDQKASGSLIPIFKSLAPEGGFLHCGPPGAGHFVKMVHNGIEYGMMSAIAEGLNILKNANAGARATAADAETTPMRDPERYRYELPLAEIAELWRHGSVISSWLVDLTAQALREDPNLSRFSGHVSDSGEGRWTLMAAIDESVPAPVISAALYGRFASRGHDEFADKVLSAMRYQFGGHVEKKAG